MTNKTDFIIIGAGIIGSGIAYTLTKSGYSVRLVDMGEPCNGAGGSTDGIIALHTKTPGLRIKMGLASAKMFPALLDELGDQCEYRENCGGYVLCEDDFQYEYVSKSVAAEKADGIDVRMIDNKELLEREPNVAPHMRGAKYASETSILNTFQIIFSYIRKAKEKGLIVNCFTKVTDYIKSEDGSKVLGIKTNNGEFYAGTTINCTGAWAGASSEPLGLHIPIFPKRGQIVISEPVAPFARGAFVTAMYVVLKYFPEQQEMLSENEKRLGNIFGFEQSESGTLMIGSTREMEGFDKNTTLDGIETVLKTAVKYMPAINNLKFIRVFSGYRPYCKDGVSVLGGVNGLDGYAICAGHEGDGISLSPLVNEMMLDYLEGREARFDLKQFSPQRFV